MYLSTISQLRLLLRGPRHSARSWCGRSLNTPTESLPNISSNTWQFHVKYREIGIPSYFPQSYLRGLSSGYVFFYSSFTATTPSLLFPVCYTLTIEDESNLSFYMFLQIYAVNVAGTGPFATATIPSDCTGLETPDALVTCKFASVF